MAKDEETRVNMEEANGPPVHLIGFCTQQSCANVPCSWKLRGEQDWEEVLATPASTAELVEMSDVIYVSSVMVTRHLP